MGWVGAHWAGRWGRRERRPHAEGPARWLCFRSLTRCPETSSRTAAAGKVPLGAKQGEAVLWAQDSDLLPGPEACLIGIQAAFVRGTVPMAIFVNAWHTGCLSALYLAASLRDESVFPPPAAGGGGIWERRWGRVNALRPARRVGGGFSCWDELLAHVRPLLTGWGQGTYGCPVPAVRAAFRLVLAGHRGGGAEGRAVSPPR